MSYRRRNRAIILRMSDDELNSFKRQYEASGEATQTDFVLRRLNERPDSVDYEKKEILYELKRQGNNLNQIARALHEGNATEQG